MANIKEYKKKDGSKAYMFNFYIGIDPITGKKKRTTRRGFKSRKEAQIALAQLRLEVNEDGDYCIQFVPPLQFFLPMFAEEFTILCGTDYH